MFLSYHIDENFAREIMQLFSMGLTQINMDGSNKLDINGNTILSYSNEDIMSLSRVWTGFDLQLRRGNYEGNNNRIDPLRIIPEWRDKFPKTETTEGYIGDRYPLCSDQPSQPYLKLGASYRFLGSSYMPELMSDPGEFATRNTTKIVLKQTSSLYNILCNEDENGKCVYKNAVTLDSNLVCDGIECELDTVRVVQVGESAYYEYVSLPCVNFVFYNNPVKISPRYSTDKVMCADPTLPVASEACCSIGNNVASRNSKYSGERMTFEVAEERCNEISKEVCDFYRVDGNYYLNLGYFWTSDSCLLRVKIKRDGTITIVHQPSDFLDRVMHISEENQNFFKVYWEKRRGYPTVDNGCDGVCQILSDATCLCGSGVLNTAVFDSMPKNTNELIKKLSIGAFNPSIFDQGTYNVTTDLETNITAYLVNNEFNIETIFEFKDDKGRTFFLKNMKSSVYLRGISGGYTGQSFRNAPQFMSFIPSETTLR